MATTDLHMQVLPVETGGAETAGPHQRLHGFARTATLIRNARREARNTLLLDNGDFLGGNGSERLPLPGPGRLHPMIEIMNHLGYDAATPGNHDFDQGMDYLKRVTEQAEFPFICANVRATGPACPTPIFADFVLLERDMADLSGQGQRLCIGITGFLPPNSIAQVEGNCCHIETRDIIEAAHDVVARMQAQGADLIIALAHTGLGSATHRPNMENAAVPLAAVKGIDAVIAGHRHKVFPGPDWPDHPALDAKAGTVHGKPVVSAGFWGSHLGLIDLELERRGGRWAVRGHKVNARPVTALAEADPRIERIIRPTHQRLVRQMAQPVGHSAHALHTFFALAAPSRAVQVIQRAQLWHVQRALQAGGAGSDVAGLPLLSSACAFKTGGYGGPGNFTNTRAGVLTMAAISDLYPFPNRLVALRVSGAMMRAWLERAASVYNRALPGLVVDLKAPEVPAYLYETVLGLEYEIDLSRPALFDQYGNRTGASGGRIRALTHQGRALGDDQHFVLITNSYRTGGGGAYPLPEPARQLALEPVDMQQVLSAYFRAHDPVRAPLEAHWRFAPLPGAKMRFRSAPQAMEHLPGMTGNEIRPAGRDAHGYQLFDMLL